MNNETLDLYNSKKLEQHKVYGAFIITMMIIMVLIGVSGIYGYFAYNSVNALMIGALGVIASILFMISPGMKARIIYPVKM